MGTQERMQAKLSLDAAFSITQTFIGRIRGIGAGYLTSANLNGSVDTAVASGRRSELYLLNMYLLQCASQRRLI